ncbi:MAG: hypothetical protein ABI432_00390 [Flavobacteriales bacterium]
MKLTIFCAVLNMAFAGMVSAQATNEFIVISTRGQVSTWVLPSDWEPRFEGEYVRFTERDRVRTEGIAAIRPKRPSEFPDHHVVELIFRTITGKIITQAFWLADRYKALDQVPQEGGFYRIDRQTLVRVGSATVQ